MDRAMNDTRAAYMTVRMVARSPNTEFGTDVLGLYESPDGGGRSLVFDIAHSFTEQDRALGQDTYSLSVESGATDYAAVASCEVSRKSVDIHVNSGSAARLGIPSKLILELDLDAAGYDQLIQGLRAILGGGSRPARFHIAE